MHYYTRLVNSKNRMIDPSKVVFNTLFHGCPTSGGVQDIISTGILTISTISKKEKKRRIPTKNYNKEKKKKEREVIRITNKEIKQRMK